jgi:hypothetical protein
MVGVISGRWFPSGTVNPVAGMGTVVMDAVFEERPLEGYQSLKSEGVPGGSRRFLMGGISQAVPQAS